MQNIYLQYNFLAHFSNIPLRTQSSTPFHSVCVCLFLPIACHINLSARSSINRLSKRAVQQPLERALVPAKRQPAVPAQRPGRSEDAHGLSAAAGLWGHSRPGLQTSLCLPFAAQWTGGGCSGGMGQVPQLFTCAINVSETGPQGRD